MVLCPKLLCLHAYPIPETRSLIIYLQITLRKIIKTVYLPEQYLIMICCMLPNHNVMNPVNRNYIEVETINEKTLGQFKNALTSTKIHEKMNHEVYANPNENYQILINMLSKDKEIYMPKSTRRYNKRKDMK